MSGPRPEGRDFRYWVRQAWRRKWLLLAVIVLVPAATYLVTKRQDKVYQASTLMKVAPQDINVSDSLSFTSSGATETATIIETTAVARLAARELGEDPAAAGGLVGKINAVVQGEGTEAGFLRITAQDSDPKQAARIANAFAAAITETRTSDAIAKVNETIANLERQADSATTEAQISTQLQQLRATRAGLAGTTQVIEPASPPTAAISPNPGRNTRIAFVLALLLAAALVPAPSA
jgi:uncharacterized protein involved in exopolysaccharide biosynthesis